MLVRIDPGAGNRYLACGAVLVVECLATPWQSTARGIYHCRGRCVDGHGIDANRLVQLYRQQVLTVLDAVAMVLFCLGAGASAGSMAKTLVDSSAGGRCNRAAGLLGRRHSWRAAHFYRYHDLAADAGAMLGFAVGVDSLLAVFME